MSVIFLYSQHNTLWYCLQDGCMIFCLWLFAKTRYLNIFLNSLSKCSVACDAFECSFSAVTLDLVARCADYDLLRLKICTINAAVLQQHRTSLWHAVLISCWYCDRRGECNLEKWFQERLCGSNSLSVSFSLSLFALLSKKHNKVLEQATQSLHGPLGADDTTVLPDYVSQFLNQFTVNQCELILWFTKSIQFGFSKCNVIKT